VRLAVVRATVVSAVVLVVLMLLENVLTSLLLPSVPARLVTDFSPAFLTREIDAVATMPPQTVFLGDSVVWGYRLPADRGAVSLLRSRGCACLNLAFKAGSPPNYDAMTRLLIAHHMRPARVVLEIDQKVFNAVDDSYAKLHPALAVLGTPLLAPADRTLLAPLPPEPQPRALIDHVLDALWVPYAMRSDVRETLAGDDLTPPAHVPTADDLDSTYDLSSLTPANVGVHFLIDTADVLRAHAIPAVAFFTPTNHRLVGEYIDNPQYRARAAYIRALLERRGVRVLDLDRAISADEFYDEVHLTARGQQHLAMLLEPAIRP
jgi:hypothetical protein